MASFVGSFRSSNLSSSRALRPTLQRRIPSSSSEASGASSSDGSEDQFVFSVGNTPVNEHPAFLQTAASSYSRASVTSAAPRDELLYGKPFNSPTQLVTTLSQSPRSKPISIELPPTRKLNLDPDSAPAETPEEPLSARGDIQGGYFPLHEDPKSRVRRPHPFHLDATKAKLRSLNRGVKSTSHVPKMPEPPQFPFAGVAGATIPETRTPVSSYIPNGVHDSAALPLGKYYPSNYERRSAGHSRHQHRQKQQQQQQQQQSLNAAVSASIMPESQAPRYRPEAMHTHSSSDVKRRLLQYQRDMVAQATMAASQLLANNTSGSVSSGSTTYNGLGMPRNMTVGGALVMTHKPLSPRLAPLGSPGPVTPMTLESNGGYLALDDQVQQRYEGTCSPVSERGAPISV